MVITPCVNQTASSLQRVSFRFKSLLTTQSAATNWFVLLSKHVVTGFVLLEVNIV